MKKGLTRLICLLLLGTSFISISAEDGDEVSAEDRYFSNPRVMMMREQALINARESKEEAIKALAEYLDEGAAREGDADIHAILEFLVLEGSKIRIFKGSYVANNYPDIRISACNLLGRLGGENSMETLLEVIRSEADYTVIAEAFLALGKIGLNPKNKVLAEMSRTMNDRSAVATEKSLAKAYLMGVKAILESTGTVNESNTFSMITRIIILNLYGKEIQQMARDLQLDIQKANK